MESRVIKLTSTAHKHGNLNIRPCGRDFFPPDVFGGPSRKSGIGVPITLQVEGLSEPIETDIPKDKAGKPRWIFRKRKWVKDFIRCHKLHASDTLIITRLDNRTYKVSPYNNGPEVIQKEHSSKTKKTRKKFLDIGYSRTYDCSKNHINCLAAKEWLKCQLGVWQFTYEGRDIRNKQVHPATFPIALARKLVDLFTHKGELVLDPFVGSGTTLIAAQDADRNAVGFDLQKEYIKLNKSRLAENISYVDNLLHNNPNAYIDFAARIDELGRQPYTSRKFFIKYQDRIIFGSDMPADIDDSIDMYRTYFRFLETYDESFYMPDYDGTFGNARWPICGIGLPKDVLAKIYYKNVLKIVPGLKEDLKNILPGE